MKNPVANRTKGLTWDVFVAPELPVVSDDLPPDLTQRTWAPVSATLISGEQLREEGRRSAFVLFVWVLPPVTGRGRPDRSLSVLSANQCVARGRRSGSWRVRQAI